MSLAELRARWAGTYEIYPAEPAFVAYRLPDAGQPAIVADSLAELDMRLCLDDAPLAARNA